MNIICQIRKAKHHTSKPQKLHGWYASRYQLAFSRKRSKNNINVNTVNIRQELKLIFIFIKVKNETKNSGVK